MYMKDTMNQRLKLQQISNLFGVQALVDGLVELSDAHGRAEVEAGLLGRARRRLQARAPLAAVLPAKVVKAVTGHI